MSGKEITDLRNTKCGWLDAEQARAINGDFGTMARFIQGLPKAELHLHIEGTLEPEQILELAKKNRMLGKLDGYDGDDSAWCAFQRQKRNFSNLQQFLDLYYAGCDVLQSEDDFYALMWSYLKKASAANVLHAEIFFDPQTHTTERNKHPVDIVINGLYRACVDAKKLSPPVDAHLILCFLRHRHPGCENCQPPAGDDDEALQCLEDVLACGLKNKLLGVGLDSGEAGNPPSLFKAAFERAGKEGLRRVAHAGEEGPGQWITDSLDELGIERVDHGVRCLEEQAIVDRLVSNKIALTVCPCSNHRLQVYNRFFAGENPVRQLMDRGLMVTLNGDDPAYFFGHKDRYGMEHDGYVNSNYLVTARECGLTADELVQLACNSFRASFITEEDKTRYLAAVQQYCLAFT